MKSPVRRTSHLMALLMLLTVVAGCPFTITPAPDDQQNANDNTDDPAGQPVPQDCVADGAGGPALPAGELLYPLEGTVAGLGEVPLLWSASDADAEDLAVTVYVSDQESVFDAPTYTEVVCLAGDTPLTASSVRLPTAGSFFWGIEITDGSNTTLRPADGVGEPFAVSETGVTRLGLTEAVLFCPNENQPARERTTFQWVLGEDIEPVRTQVFVGRSGEDNPFDAALFVFDEVTPPTATSWTMPEDAKLPIGEPLSWGLRVETADRILFSLNGLEGMKFTAAANVAPTGSLVGPDDGAVLADGVADFILSWSADPGNCEDELTSTVYFERLAGESAPTDLFGSPIRLDVADGSLEANVAAAADELGLVAGVWAWSVRADDGTDVVALAGTDGGAETFRTFVRDTGPRFVEAPSIGMSACAADGWLRDALLFEYADDNGLDTVTVTITQAATEADLFDDPAQTLTLGAVADGGSATVSLIDISGATCPVFAAEAGVIGVTLDDGVNPVVRASASYAPNITGACCAENGSCSEGSAGSCTGDYQGDFSTCDVVDCPQPPSPPPGPPITPPEITDCNGNGVEDSDDIASGTSRDCNFNGIPDECGDAGTQDCNQNGIWDTCDIVDGTSQDCNLNGIPDECNDAGTQDCNSNGIWDACDIVEGTSTDCNFNGRPDECEDVGGDCNDNGVWDLCDVVYGTSTDCDGNLRPDECQEFMMGDMNFDGSVTLEDLPILEDCWTGPCETTSCDPPLYGVTCCFMGDFDFDGDVDLDDFAVFDNIVGG